MQEAVPTSSGLATSATELEASSSLFSGTFLVSTNWNDSLNTTLLYSHFAFNDLSSAVALDSLQRGNSITKVGSASAYFVYKYVGDEVLFRSQYKFKNLIDLKLETAFVKNSSAPDGINEGYYYSIQPGVVINSNLTIRPLFGSYHVESDTIVGTFLDPNYGRANRCGYNYGFNIEAKKYNLELIYSKSSLIANNPFQSADRSVYLTLNFKI